MEMTEVEGNIWSFRGLHDWTVITTNGSVKRDGCAVMGRGTAWQASRRYPALPKKLGERIKRFGNCLHVFEHPHRIIAMPVKHEWWERADLELIAVSVRNLMLLAERRPAGISYYLPRPGCGNGQRQWSEVRPLLEKWLDDRFTVVEINP